MLTRLHKFITEDMAEVLLQRSLMRPTQEAQFLVEQRRIQGEMSIQIPRPNNMVQTAAGDPIMVTTLTDTTPTEINRAELPGDARRPTKSMSRLCPRSINFETGS